VDEFLQREEPPWPSQAFSVHILLCYMVHIPTHQKVPSIGTFTEC
jgi:hypothetical protein